MHRVRSLDYAIILFGEIDMRLDDGDVHLKAGDVIVQQASNHGWVNRGKGAVSYPRCANGREGSVTGLTISPSHRRVAVLR